VSVQPGLCDGNDLRVGRKMATFLLFFQSKEQVVARWSQIWRIVCVWSRPQVGQFLLGCKCPVSWALSCKNKTPLVNDRKLCKLYSCKRQLWPAENVFSNCRQVRIGAVLTYFGQCRQSFIWRSAGILTLCRASFRFRVSKNASTIFRVTEFVTEGCWRFHHRWRYTFRDGRKYYLDIIV
jgi:hypothetical protein